MLANIWSISLLEKTTAPHSTCIAHSPLQVRPWSRPHCCWGGTSLYIGSFRLSLVHFLSPFALDDMLSILHFPISTLALPTGITVPPLTLIVHALKAVHTLWLFSKKKKQFRHCCQCHLSTTVCMSCITVQNHLMPCVHPLHSAFSCHQHISHYSPCPCHLATSPFPIFSQFPLHIAALKACLLKNLQFATIYFQFTYLHWPLQQTCTIFDLFTLHQLVVLIHA